MNLNKDRPAGRYRVCQVIGRGMMGNVYLAMDEHLHQKVVIKETMPKESEAALLLKVNHPSLLRVFDMIYENEKTYLVCEYIDGINLKELTCRSLNEQTILKWSIVLSDVLDYLHTRPIPIIHRDIKPENVMLRTDGMIKLIDFGIALESGIDQSHLLPYGTKGFAAPEQYAAGLSQSNLQIDERTDLYSLGKLIEYLIHEKCAEPASKSLQRLVRRCVNPKPSKRYQNANHLKKDLTRIYHLKSLTNKSILFYILIAICISICILLSLLSNFSTHQISNSKQSETELMYEAAKVYFYERKDYEHARIYFELIKKEQLPDVRYYISLCDSMLHFTSNEQLEHELDEALLYIRGQAVTIEQAQFFLELLFLYRSMEETSQEKKLLLIEYAKDELVALMEQSQNQEEQLNIDAIRVQLESELFMMYYELIIAVSGADISMVTADYVQQGLDFGEEMLAKKITMTEEDDAFLFHLEELYESRGMQMEALELFRNCFQKYEYPHIEFLRRYLICLVRNVEADAQKPSSIQEEQGSYFTQEEQNELQVLYDRVAAFDDADDKELLQRVECRLKSE